MYTLAEVVFKKREEKTRINVAKNMCLIIATYTLTLTLTRAVLLSFTWFR